MWQTPFALYCISRVKRTNTFLFNLERRLEHSNNTSDVSHINGLNWNIFSTKEFLKNTNNSPYVSTWNWKSTCAPGTREGVVNLKARKIWLELYLCWLLRCLYCFSEGIITQSSTEQHVHVHLVLLSCVLKINWTVTVLLIQLVDLVPTVKGAHFLWMHWNCSIHLKIPFQHVCGSILQTVLH